MSKFQPSHYFEFVFEQLSPNDRKPSRSVNENYTNTIGNPIAKMGNTKAKIKNG